MAGQYKVYVDWNADGDFSDPREDVTSDVLDGRTALSMQFGRDQERALSPIGPGEAQLALDNQSRVYSPENTSSALYGQVVPSRSVQVTGTVGASTYMMFRGDLDDLTLLPGREDRYLSVSCIDGLGQLRGTTISTGVYQGLRPGEAIGLVLDAVGWPATLRDLDVGATVMPFWWLDGADAFDAILEIVNSEGPPALVTIDATTGNFVFRSRHHRLLNSVSTTAQSTWRSSGVEPVISAPTSYNAGFKEIVNAISFELPQYMVTGDLTTVWSSQGLLSVASGETKQIVAQGSSPFINATPPVQDTDYSLVSGTVTITLSRTSGASTTILVTASGGAAIISGLSLRAQAVSTSTTIQVTAEDGGSIIKYGRSSLPSGREPKWASAGDADAICQIILGQRAERLPTVAVTMVSANTTRLTQQLTRDLSDRVHITEAHSGLDADCFIERIAHTITQGGTEHRTTFGLEKCPTQISGAFILGTSLLGTGVLGRRGLANPSTMFVLGTSLLGTGILTA